MAIIIRSDGKIEPIEDLSLDSLQETVGGMIDIVPARNGRFVCIEILVVDDEGLLKDKPVNKTASLLYGGEIRGDVVAAMDGEIE
jgi:hypothetical protein